MQKEKTFREWLTSQFDKEDLQDIYSHGCVNGFSGLTYYSDTVSLYEQYKDDIWDRLYDEAESYGSDNILEFIGSFNGAKDVGSEKQFQNLLVWWMAESIAYEICELEENDEEDEYENL